MNQSEHPAAAKQTHEEKHNMTFHMSLQSIKRTYLFLLS